MNEQVPLNRFKYFLMPGKCPHNFQHLDLYNQVYGYWKNFWDNVLTSLDGTSHIRSDEFLRQDIVPVIFYGNEIVAIHLYTFFDLRWTATFDHTYICNNFPKTFTEELEERRLKRLMSLEYLTVSSEWRKHRLGFSWAHVLLGLGLNLLREYNIDAGIAPTRNDVKMNELAYLFGFECLIPKAIVHNVECDLVVCEPRNIKSHPEQKVREAIDWLWENRVSLLNEDRQKQSKAA